MKLISIPFLTQIFLISILSQLLPSSNQNNLNRWNQNLQNFLNQPDQQSLPQQQVPSPTQPITPTSTISDSPNNNNNNIPKPTETNLAINNNTNPNITTHNRTQSTQDNHGLSSAKIMELPKTISIRSGTFLNPYSNGNILSISQLNSLVLILLSSFDLLF